MDSTDGDKLNTVESKPPGLRLKLSAGIFLFFVWYITFFPWIRYQFWQSDTWWLIETGRIILDTRALPTHDPFSFTSIASHWTTYQWLTEVLFGIAHAFDGLTGVSLLGGMLMGLLLFVLMFRHLLKAEANPIVAVMAIILCAYSYFPDFSSLRPQIFSFVLFWLTLVLCQDTKEGAKPWRVLGPAFAIAVIWANCHISFPSALLMITANLVGSGILFLAKKTEIKVPLLFASMLAVFFAGTFVTPFGGALWSFIANTHNLFYTQEVGPLVWTEQPLLMTMAIISFVCCLVLRKKLDIGDYLTWLGLIFVGSNCIRLIVYFCIFSCPIIALGVSQLIGPALSKGGLGRLGTGIKTVALSRWYIPAMVLFICYVVLCQPTRIPRNIPIEAAQYLKEHPVTGNMFCSAYAGSYLIYTAHGKIPVFMDTRIDLYDAAFCKQFIDTLDYGKNWKETFDQYKIQAALVPNGAKLRYILDNQPDWKCVHRDRYFSLFVPGHSEQSF